LEDIFVPDLDPLSGARVPFPPVDDDEEDGEPSQPTPPALREGLPAGYRMRHDSHYVDQLLARSSPRSEERSSAPEPIAPGLAETLLDTFETILTCLGLVAGGRATMREKVAIDLIQTEVDAAMLQLFAARSLTEESLERKAIAIGAFVEDIASRLQVTNRLAGTSISVQSETDASVRGDARLLSVAIAGAIRAAQALGVHVREPHVAVRIAAAGDGAIAVRIGVRGVAIPPARQAGFFDLAWPERPGGYSAALSLRAARHIAGAHDGRLELASDVTGLSLTFTLPRL
jgi:hypothetical protein